MGCKQDFYVDFKHLMSRSHSRHIALILYVFDRFTEKGNLEVLLFTIQSKMRANNQKVYMPREGKLISDINKVYIHQMLLYM